MRKRQAIGYIQSVDPLLMQPLYPVFEEGTHIGRDSDHCQVILSREFVSRRHCSVEPGEGGLVLCDLDTTNGTFVNGNRVKRHRLSEGDRIGLGKPIPHHFVFTQTPQAGPRNYLLPPGKVYRIGRALDCDLPLLHDPTVSWEHARIRVQARNLSLEDLNSANGTFVNGELVRAAPIGPEDTVRIGTCELQFAYADEGLRIILQERRNQVRLESLGLTRTHRSLAILRDISLAIEPGEYVGVLGPSGAGKSTLLNALNGFQPANGGEVLMNGVSLYRSYDMFRNSIGYVPQDDIIHRELTVERSLVYTALLRLPRDTAGEQIEQQVTSVIETLGLSHVRGNLVANLSGGQRKRVSIGCELLTKPSIIFLDEPTSGLDPSTEEKLMRHFRMMSEQGQSVILTTHILYNLDLLDMVVLLARGRLVYFGPTREVCNFFDTPAYPVARPIEIFDVLEPETPDSVEREKRAEFYERRYLESPLYEQYVAGRISKSIRRSDGIEVVSRASEPDLHDVPARKPDARAKPRRLRSIFKQLIDIPQLQILTRRMLDIKVSLPSRFAVPLITPIVLALLTATTALGNQSEIDAQRQEFEQGNPGFLAMLDQPGTPVSGPEFVEMRFQGFANLAIPLSLPLTMVMTAVFLGTLSACLEISGERSIYLRERAVNLSIPTYVASKFPALFLLSAMQCFIYAVVALLLLRPTDVDILRVIGILVGISWVSCAIGLFISSLDPSAGQNSVILAVVAVLPQMIFSGAMAPDFYGGMSVVTRVFADILPARWGFELMLNALYQTPEWAEALITGPVDRGGMGFRFGSGVYVRNAGALAALLFTYFTATCISMKRYDRL